MRRRCSWAMPGPVSEMVITACPERRSSYASRRMIPAPEAVASMAWDLAGDDPAGFRAIEAIVISGNGPTIVPIDGVGKPLWNALTWMDRRASHQAAEAGRALGRQIDPEYNLPKILWFREHKPDVYKKAKFFVSCPEYVCGRLSGTWATFLPAQGFQEIIWDDEALEAFGERLLLAEADARAAMQPGEGDFPGAAAARQGVAERSLEPAQ